MINGCFRKQSGVDWIEWEWGQEELARGKDPQKAAVSRRNTRSKSGDGNEVQM